jgi:hypothetical protein
VVHGLQGVVPHAGRHEVLSVYAARRTQPVSHDGAFFLSVALAHQVIGLEWLSRTERRVYLGGLVLGVVRRPKGKRRLELVIATDLSPMSLEPLLPMSKE